MDESDDVIQFKTDIYHSFAETSKLLGYLIENANEDELYELKRTRRNLEKWKDLLWSLNENMTNPTA